MAQLRQDYDQFQKRGAEVVVIGPEDQNAFKRYWEKENLPYVGVANPDHSVLKAYGQRVKLLRLGRLPSVVVVDRAGMVYFQHHGNSMSDIPSNSRILQLLDEINALDG